MGPGLLRGRKQGWQRAEGSSGKGEKLGGQNGSGLFYNKIRSSNLSRTGLWDPQRVPPHAG